MRWVSRNGKDSKGVPFIVLTCTECLRSFPLNVTEEATPEVRETPCLFYANVVRYIIDFSLSVVSPEKKTWLVLANAKVYSGVGADINVVGMWNRLDNSRKYQLKCNRIPSAHTSRVTTLQN